MRTLAIGLDAGEPTLIRRLIDGGRMPALRALLDRGAHWLRVSSPAPVGSGAVWPTFISGLGPADHGVYGEWCWQPDTMGLKRYDGRGLTPFWSRLAQAGARVGVLDVPFAPLVGLTDGFEISEWGPHDVIEARMQYAPPAVGSYVTGDHEPHPLSIDRLDAAGPRDTDALTRLGTECVRGIRLRGALAERLIVGTRPAFALLVFPEIHHSAHHLWHAVAPDHALYDDADLASLPLTHPTLEDIYEAFDAEVARLVRLAGDDANVFVFSLHGMQPTRGIPAWLSGVLCDAGFATLAGFRSQGWPERAAALLGVVKRVAPASVKRLYYRHVPANTAQALARPNMMPAYDWSRTRAFALPTDQHGWVRINLVGREALGIVAATDYDATCAEIAAMLRSLATEDGRPLVRDVVRQAPNAERARQLRLPDLVVHWADAAFDRPPRVRGITASLPGPIGLKFTGQHAMDGFCVARSASAVGMTTVDATELHRLITGATV